MSSIRLEGVVKKFTDKEISLFKKKGREMKTMKISPSFALIGSINASYFLVKNIFLNW